jgi:adenosylhomocysteine nucleosidase
MTRVAIIAAMAGELKPLVRGWQHESRNGVDLWRWRYAEGEWIAACAGAGVDRARQAFAEIERDGAIDLAVSVGWAGALSVEFAPGKAYRVCGVIDARTGERFGSEDSASHPSRKNKDAARVGHPDSSQVRDPDLWLVTSATVADEAEKQRLVLTYHAGLVDMEAAEVARLAAMRKIPFHCIKGVSDGFRDKLPDFNRFIAASGKFQLFRFIVFAALRPRYWHPLVRMGENSRRAAQSIAESLLDLLDERGQIRKNNGYPNLKS